MNRSLYLAVAAFFVAALVSGCGNTRELEASLAEKQAAVDSLTRANTALAAENAKLRARADNLEKSLASANARAIDLERQLEQIRSELEQSKPKAKGDLEGAYREALRNYMEGHYDEAIARFEELLAAGIPDPLNDNCHYWIGESLFGMGRYQEAAARFDEVIAFTWSNKKDDSQLMIARCYGRMGDAERARAEYRKLVETYPASPYVDLARQRAGGAM